MPNRNITFPEETVTNYRDLSPRMGAAWDVFGTGKTAVKVSLNRYTQDLSLLANSGGSQLSNFQSTRDPVVDRQQQQLLSRLRLASTRMRRTCGHRRRPLRRLDRRERELQHDRVHLGRTIRTRSPGSTIAGTTGSSRRASSRSSCRARWRSTWRSSVGGTGTSRSPTTST